MSAAFYSRQDLMMLDRPQLVLASISGDFYTKETPGAAFYTPPLDTLNLPGSADGTVTSQMMTAAALGAAGVRLYQFEPPQNEAGRASAPLGSVLQTGGSPVANDIISQSIWQAMSAAANALTGVLEPYILGTPQNSPAFGRNIVTAVRASANGSMLMIVNDNDWKRTLYVDFKPFGPTIGRYVINFQGSQYTYLSGASAESITLNEGETVAYLFAATAGSRRQLLHHKRPKSAVKVAKAALN
jgi:hypothetical protein